MNILGNQMKYLEIEILNIKIKDSRKWRHAEGAVIIPKMNKVLRMLWDVGERKFEDDHKRMTMMFDILIKSMLMV